MGKFWLHCTITGKKNKKHSFRTESVKHRQVAVDPLVYWHVFIFSCFCLFACFFVCYNSFSLCLLFALLCFMFLLCSSKMTEWLSILGQKWKTNMLSISCTVPMHMLASKSSSMFLMLYHIAQYWFSITNSSDTSAERLF